MSHDGWMGPDWLINCNMPTFSLQSIHWHWFFWRLDTIMNKCFLCVSVKDLRLKGRSLPHFTPQEFPMKPSQVPNQLPHPPSRRMLPFQSHELCHRDKWGPPRHPPQYLGPICSSGYVQSSPTSIGSSANRPHPTPRDRQGPLHHSAQPPGSSYARPTPVSPTNNGTTANKPQPLLSGVFHPASPSFMRDSGNYISSSHMRRGQVTESKDTLSYSGRKNVTAQRQESKKVIFSLFKMKWNLDLFLFINCAIAVMWCWNVVAIIVRLNPAIRRLPCILSSSTDPLWPHHSTLQQLEKVAHCPTQTLSTGVLVTADGLRGATSLLQVPSLLTGVIIPVYPPSAVWPLARWSLSYI